MSGLPTEALEKTGYLDAAGNNADLFAAMSLQFADKAAYDRYEKCMQRSHKLWAVPGHAKRIKFSTEASLKEMIAPGLFVILRPLVASIGSGSQAEYVRAVDPDP